MAALDHAAQVEQVRSIMREKGISRRSACEELGCSESSIRRWEQDLDGSYPEDSFSYQDGYTEIPVVFRDYSSQPAHYLYPLGDVHKGSPAHDAKKWREWLEFLGNKSNASLLGTGDYLNSALKTSVSEVYDEVQTVGHAKRELRAEFRPVANKIDLLIPGNHEDRIYRAVGDCPILDVADSLDVPYARKAALVVYQVGQVEYLVYVRHGTGGGAVGARAARLQKQAQTLHADVYVSGHTHSQLVFPEEIFMYDPGSKTVIRKRRYFVSAGSFLRYEEYASGSAFAPTKLGAPRIRLDGESWDIHVSV